MKNSLFHIIFFTTLFQYCNCYAETDSLPTCISSVLQIEPRTVTQYDYKGQHLFSYKTSKQAKPQNNSDQMSTIRFYDSNCHLVFTWIKGGIAGLNKTIPDSIQKEKIITIRTDTLDTIVVKKNGVSLKLPDSIEKMALLKKSYWIEEHNFQGKYIYRLQDPTANPNTSKIKFANPYYDENGKILNLANSVGKIFWWHFVNGKFSKTQFRPGFR